MDPSIFQAGPRFSDTDYMQLLSPITDEMIKEYLFHIGNEKSPGPDGFNVVFFKHNWETVQSYFHDAVHELFSNGVLLKQLNHAAISLIPKGKHEPTAADFYPLSCCNVVFKTISKVIANKLAPLLHIIINPSQVVY